MSEIKNGRLENMEKIHQEKERFQQRLWSEVAEMAMLQRELRELGAKIEVLRKVSNAEEPAEKFPLECIQIRRTSVQADLIGR